MVGHTNEVSIVVLLLLSSPIFAQFSSPKQKYFARSSEVPHVICDVCQRGVRHLNREVKHQTASKGKLDEDDVLSIVEKVCNTDSKHGSWIEKYDIVEDGGKLKLAEHSERGKCREECKTIAKACEESIAEVDTDVGELLWKQKYTTSQLVNEICSKMTSACKKKPSNFKANREDEKFISMSADEQKANDMMKEMKGVPGMPGMEMYSREDLEKMRNSLGPDSSQGEESNKELPEQERVKSKGNPGFLETVHAVAGDVVRWFKNLFGYGSKKSEL